MHVKKARYIEQSDNDYEPLVRQNAITTSPPKDTLQRQNALPNPQHVSSRLMFESQQVANPAAYTKVQPFKFKHPFCMMVAGPRDREKRNGSFACCGSGASESFPLLIRFCTVTRTGKANTTR